MNFNVEAGERIAIIGQNGIGKTTLMRLLAGELQPSNGTITWVENAKLGYMPQDPQAEFANKVDLFTWMSEWRAKGDDDQIVRATLGRLLFSGDETTQVGEGAVRRREGPHDLRQADAHAGRTCCCWTSPPTTWTWKPSSRCRSAWRNIPAR